MTATAPTPIRRLPDTTLDLSPALRAEFERMTAVASNLRASSHSLGHAARRAIAEGLTEEEFVGRARFAYYAESTPPKDDREDQTTRLSHRWR